MGYTVPAVPLYQMLSGIGDSLNAGNDQANQQAAQAYQQALQTQQANAATAALNGQPYNPPAALTPPVPQSFMQRLVGGLTGNQPAPVATLAPIGPQASPTMQGALPISPGVPSAPNASGQPKNYYAKLAQIESGNDPNAVSPTGAGGLFQFTNGTWDQYGGGASKFDPRAQFAAVQGLTNDNQAALSSALGRPPTAGELYLAHQQGAGGAIKLLTNPNATPNDLGLGHAVAVNGGNPDAPAAQFVSKWTSKFADTPSPYAPPGAPTSVADATRAPSNLVAGPGVGSSVSPDNVAANGPTQLPGAITPTPDTSAPAVATAAAPAGTVSFGGRNYTLGQAYAMLQSPTMKPIGEALIKRFGEQTGQVAPMTAQQKTQFGIPAEDTRVWTINTQTGKPEAIASDKDTQTSEQKNYEYYKKQTTDAGGEPKTFEQWEATGGVKGLQPHVVAAGAALVGPDGKVLYKGQGAASMPDQTADFLAERILAGDTKAMTGLGRGAQGAENIAKVQGLVAQKAAERGLDAKDMLEASAEQAGLNAQQRTFGTQTARMASASVEAQGAIALGREASANVPRTEFVPANKAWQTYENAVSDPNLSKFAASNLTIANTMARAINPNGVPTVEDKKHLYESLSTTKGPEAYNATLDQFQAEIDLAHKSPQVAQAMLKNIRKGKPAMEGITSQPLTPEAGVFTAGEQGAATQPSGATPKQQPTVSTGAAMPDLSKMMPAQLVNDAKKAFALPDATPEGKEAVRAMLRQHKIDPARYGLQ